MSAHFKKTMGVDSEGKSIDTFMQLGQMDPCGCFGWGDCPCCHFFLKDICTGEKTFFWADGGALVGGDEATFKAACDACKGDTKKKSK